ncbi:hypothetical protein [Mesorhizobium sp. ORM16]|uniref:hypothetical protein n=1 Tax=Mesorhizobium sp. ORM16 TaxID=3376989 RepID=UPI003857F443
MTEQDQPTTKLCLMCCTPIPARARKCTTCGEFQDWRRLIPWGNSTLALLTALISVTTVAVVPLGKVVAGWSVDRDDARVTGVMTEMTTNSATVAFLNTGTARSFVDTGLTCAMLVRKQPGPGYDQLIYRDEDISHVAVIKYIRSIDPNGGLVEPGKLAPYNYVRTSVKRVAYNPANKDFANSCTYHSISEGGGLQSTQRVIPPITGALAIYYSGIDETTPPPPK